MHQIILAKEPIKKILLSYVGKESGLKMRTASLKTFPLVKTKSDTGGAWLMGYPGYLSKEGVSEQQ